MTSRRHAGLDPASSKILYQSRGQGKITTDPATNPDGNDLTLTPYIPYIHHLQEKIR